MNIGKKCLRNHGAVEYHAVGVAMATACMAAERLMRFNYANLVKIETSQVESDRSKVTIRLGKAPTFEAAEKEFEAQRETAAATATATATAPES
jgi:hypothetical protein